MKTLKQNPDVVLFVILAAVFLIWPEIDLIVSRWFYDPQDGFIYKDTPWVVSVYALFRHAPKLILPLLLIMLILSYVKGRWGLGTDQKRPWLFLFLALLIGPGLLVHLVFKEAWDRPRPRQVVEFGGSKDFIPAFIPAAAIKDQRGNNKSFVSGHAAMGAYLMALAWVFRRRSWLWAGLVMGAVVSLGRLVQGGHFLSDVLFATFFCYFVYRGLAWWLLGHSRITDNVEKSTA